MKALLDVYYHAQRYLLTVLMALIIVPVSLQILSRYTGFIPRYIWTEEAARFCFIWIIMLGAMIGVRDGSHFDVDLLRHPQTERGLGLSKLVVHLGMLVMSLSFVWYGVAFAKFGFIQNSEMSGINMLWIYGSFPLAGATWVLFLIEKMVEDVRLIRSRS